MNKTINLTATIMAAVFLFSCKEPVPMDLSKEHLIPKPARMEATGLSFEWTAKTRINIPKGNEEVKMIANYLADFIAPATGFSNDINEKENPQGSKGITLVLTDDKSVLNKEGYELTIEPKRILLKAHQPTGLFRGVQTIRQLLPARIESDKLQQGPWLIASGIITDAPQYGYRGAMLDVVRHFFGVEDVKRYIDFLATYKMNILHLHLTDDQGWRIEIKSWPKLTEIGGSTQVGGGEGGFFTQEQYKEIVDYAADRYITVIPEIDMPGHTNAALASYPELNKDGKAPKLYTGTRVGFSTLDANKEITYKFVDDVVRELAAITPGEYIHIGGDESFVTKKKDYIKFVEKAQDIVNAHGKKMMGWADISAAKLKDNSVAQFWHTKTKTALDAVAQDVKIIMSPATRAYMDIKYDTICPLGLNWAGYTEVDDAYDWTLETNVKGIPRESIIGVEAPLWSETVETMDDIEFLVFPRLPGYAELGWSPDKNNSWDEYKVRLGKQKQRFEYMDINYYQSKLVPWANEDKQIIVAE